MRLYRGSIEPAAREIAKALISAGDIETEAPEEVARDIESVMSNYLAIDREALEKAKDLVQQRNLPPTELPRIRKLTAEQKGIKTGDEVMDYLLDQFIEILLHSTFVDEVYAEDHDLRRRMRPILKKHLSLDETLDAEVRNKIKHVEEGSRSWEVEYQRVMEDIQRRRGLR